VNTTEKKPKPRSLTSRVAEIAAKLPEGNALDHDLTEAGAPPRQRASPELDAAQGTQPAAPQAGAADAGGQPPAPTADAQPSATPIAAGATKPADQGDVPPTSATAPTGQAAPQAGASPATATDPWTEYDEIEYADGDTGEKYKVRAPKTYAEKVRNGYARRSIMDRHTGALGKHKTWLEPLVVAGALDGIAPLIQDATRDPELAAALTQIYNRRRMGLPLADPVQQQQTPPPQAPAQQQQHEDLLARLKVDPNIDDYTRGVLENYLGPMTQELAQARTYIAEQRIATQQQQQRQQTATQQQQFLNDAASRAETELRQLYPDEINQQTPRETLVRIGQYAQEGGYLQRFGVSPGAFILAYQAMRSPMGYAGIGGNGNGNGYASSGSVAAASLAEAKLLGAGLAAQAAQQVGHSVAPTTSSLPPEPEPQRKRPSRFVDDGKGGKRPRTAKEIAQWYERNG
jgi:hypothetical protein